MTEYSTSILSELTQVRKELGHMRVEEIKAPSIAIAHEILGKKHAKQIKAYLGIVKREGDYTQRTEQALEALGALRQQGDELKSLKPKVSSAIFEYLESLDSWAKGAGVSKDDAAALQNEFGGCTAMMIRNSDLGIGILHLEEDDLGEEDESSLEEFRLKRAQIPTRIASPTWTRFEIEGINHPMDAYTSYSTVLGGTFTFNGAIMTGNFLELKNNTKGGILSNSAMWILWRLGPDIDEESVLQSLGPFFDGQAINIVKNHNGNSIGKTIEFSGHFVTTRHLGLNPGDTLSQSNVFSGKDADQVRSHSRNDMPEDDMVYYAKIIKTTSDIDSALGKKSLKGGRISSSLLPKIASLIPNGKREKDLGRIPHLYTIATLIGNCSNGRVELSLSSGPLTPINKIPDIILNYRV